MGLLKLLSPTKSEGKRRTTISRTRYVQEHWDLGSVEELIHHRRHQVLVHSILYYRMDSSIIPDDVFDRWAYELARIQKEHPEASGRVIYHRETFSNFNGETGHHLPLLDPHATETAFRLLALHLQNERGFYDD